MQSPAIFGESFLLSLFLTPAAIRLSRKFKILDLPSARKVHQEATPRLGGLAVCSAVFLSLAVCGGLRGFILAGAVLFAVGLWEDVKGLSASARLVGQAAAAMIIIAGGLRFDFQATSIAGKWGEVLYTAVWLVGITNAMNFLDGIDGLAATLGALCAGLFFVAVGPRPPTATAFLAAALAGACLGFLPYNWRTARVFLGDGGSTFIGFSLAVLGAAYGPSAPGPAAALCVPVIILGIPIFDMVYTTASRLGRGDVRTFTQWLEYAGKDHLHHQLLKRNLSAAQVVGCLAGVNLGLGAAALAFAWISR